MALDLDEHKGYTENFWIKKYWKKDMAVKYEIYIVRKNKRPRFSAILEIAV